MPNRKIKHIIAKLVGASTEETLDVYDVDAVHTDKIYNALDQTAAGYVLDARQGKALNDSLNNPILKTVTSLNQVNINGLKLYRIGRLCVIQGTLLPTVNVSSWANIFSINDTSCEPLGGNAILSLAISDYSNMYLEVLKGTNPVRVATGAALTANKTYKVGGCWITQS